MLKQMTVFFSIRAVSVGLNFTTQLLGHLFTKARPHLSILVPLCTFACDAVASRRLKFSLRMFAYLLAYSRHVFPHLFADFLSVETFESLLSTVDDIRICENRLIDVSLVFARASTPNQGSAFSVRIYFLWLFFIICLFASLIRFYLLADEYGMPCQ